MESPSSSEEGRGYVFGKDAGGVLHPNPSSEEEGLFC
jgi:hypothetical protein